MAVDRRALEYGTAAERAVCRLLQSRGWSTLLASSTGGPGAALLRKGRQSVVLPDILAARRGVVRWLEVKAYKSPELNRSRGVYVHGVQGRHWRDYEVTSRLTGCPVHIAIVERAPTDGSPPGGVWTREVSGRETFTCQCFGCSPEGSGECRARLEKGVYWPKRSMVYLDQVPLDTVAGLTGLAAHAGLVKGNRGARRQASRP